MSMNIQRSAAPVVVEFLSPQRHADRPRTGVVRRKHLIEIDCLATIVRDPGRVNRIAAGADALEHQRLLLVILALHTLSVTVRFRPSPEGATR